MVLLFLVDVISSVAFRITVNVGTWIACKSMNGLYYAYSAIRPNPPIHKNTSDCLRDRDYVLITRDEYERLVDYQS